MRVSGFLGDDVIKFAQFLILASLPVSRTSARQVTRRARVRDNASVDVTYTAILPGVDLSFGGDRQLLAWIFDQAINSESPVIPWSRASRRWRRHSRSSNSLPGIRPRSLRKRISAFPVFTSKQSTPHQTHSPTSLEYESSWRGVSESTLWTSRSRFWSVFSEQNE